MVQGMNNQMGMAGGGGMAMFGFGFQSAASQVQQAPMQQIQQLQNLFKSAFQSFFQQAGQFSQMTGGGFGQSPAASPGFVGAPNQHAQCPQNPGSFAQTPQMGQMGQMNQMNQMGQMGQMGQGQMGQMGQMGGAAFGGFAFGGFIPFGGQQGGIGQTPEIKPPSKGIEQLGENKFKTPGGYTVEATGKSAEWKVTSPEGKQTRVWGDPHVETAGKKFDFKNQSSLALPDGTKITIATTPPTQNGYTVTQDIHIQNGSQRASITGIDKNKPTSTGVKNDRYEFDKTVKDGDYIALGKDMNWYDKGKNMITGSTKQGAEFKTGAAAGANVTQESLAAMQEGGLPQGGGWNIPGMPNGQTPGMPGGFPGGTPPIFGGQQHGVQMVMQMAQQLMQMLQGMGLGGVR